MVGSHRHLIVLLITIAVALAPFSAYSSDPDVASDSAFFTQTGRGDGSGYYVRDGVDGRGNPMRLFSEFRRLGGVDVLGYPVSRPFLGVGGYSYQAFQRGVLQWRPDTGRAALANTFEWLQQGGRDAWLGTLGVPPAIADDQSNGDWNKARATRLSWLTDPIIQQSYLGGASTGTRMDEAIQLYGLPMSMAERRGPFIVQRFQRIALQLWLDSVPGMPPPGSVVGVLGGDMLKQSGLIPGDALAPELTGSAVKATAINGLYLSSVAAGRDDYRQRVFDLAKTTEISAVVVDVKNEFGYTTYASEVPLAKQIGAAGRPTVAGFAAWLALFRQRGLYVIARLPVFKDDLLARSRPDWAIVDPRVGAQPWRDAKGLAWTDPYHEEVWDYNIALAKEAALRGVDEVQFDFIRFPGDAAKDGSSPQVDNPKRRAAAIEAFLARASAELRPLGVKLAADLFGYTIWTENDLAVGQNFDAMVKYLDVVSPMLYPSSFTAGIPGYRTGVDHPYEIVLQSVQRATSRLAGKSVQVRPWLQDFADYAFDGRPFTVKEVSAQVRAAKEAGAAGFMLWNPTITYTRGALAPK